MSILHHMGVRSRMVTLIMATIAPFLALIAAGILFSYSEADRATRRNIASDAELGAAKFSRVFLDAKVVLGTLRGMPPLQASDRARCDGFVQKVLASQPMFVTMGVLDAAGNIVCHNKPDTTGQFGDMELALRMANAGADELLVGRFMIGPVSKKPTVAVAMRLPTTSAGEQLSIFGALNLDVFNHIAQSIVAETNHTVALIDPTNQRVLVRSPTIVPFGTAFPGHPLIEAIAGEPDGGTTFSIGFDDIHRFFGFAPVADATGSSLAVSLGLPEAEAFADVQGRATWAIVLAIVALITAILLSATIAYWTQLRPLVRLVLKSERLGEGKFTSPVTIEGWQAQEFRSLATSLNQTAGKLQAAQEIERKNMETERRFRLVADNTADMITAVDLTGRRTFVSGASRDVLGYEPQELIGRAALDLVHEEDRDRVRELFRRTRDIPDVGAEQYRVTRKDGTLLWVEVSGRRMADESGLVFTMRNISKRKAVEAELEAANSQLLRLATTDELTGINNRRELNRLVELETRRSGREGQPLSVMLIDVDHFKAFNDIYGHVEGDRCLKEIAAAISGAIRRPADSCARYGGEEFAVLLPNTDATGASNRAEVIRRAVASLGIVHSGHQQGHVTISIGVTTAQGELGQSALFEAADQALYVAKAGGRDRVVASALDMRDQFADSGRSSD
ncbi:PAS domain S-box-containing protein/diguanylate cyclase (GGDEF) domain-containing protein [Rhizobium sp. NFR07]|uniref:sensor domain-containing diguanylate cyclase n=1 Tax=Rhizobium sp. NFR07 TaxID=1566262 RepID=UPI0008E87C38|nr:diguanylate cyclase [Rhizobium sp. NFR07]SFB56174.1 PAS domain S-box-containing protein/diguanylate cyclase (GGDEF) domain-containing protein [Rhizobium sp. NFR07]